MARVCVRSAMPRTTFLCWATTRWPSRRAIEHFWFEVAISSSTTTLTVGDDARSLTPTLRECIGQMGEERLRIAQVDSHAGGNLVRSDGNLDVGLTVRADVHPAVVLRSHHRSAVLALDWLACLHPFQATGPLAPAEGPLPAPGSTVRSYP